MDEVQNLKNSKSLGAAVARKVQTKFRLCLTGTPVENDLLEFTNILDLAVPGIWGHNLGADISQQGSEGRAFARQMARPFLLRRTKEQVLKELPPKTEQSIYLSFSDEEESRYRQKLVSIQEELNSNEKGKNNILTQLLELRLLCLWQHTNQFVSTKIKFLMETLEQILEENHSCLIFSQFTTYLDHIGKAMAKKQWNFCRLDGSMLPGKRQNEVNRFQEGECPLFLISLKAGGTGLNLTKASYVFIMDPWWNPVVEQQAIDRTHRIGQLNPVTIYRPIIKNSVEERVLELQKSKRELFNDLLGQGDGKDDVFSGRLTYEDFKYLLS
jgi:SNF2 family DNA or RNA helicase